MQQEAVRSSLSMYSMFMDSDLFMKVLILGLLFTSVWCWAIIYDKILTDSFNFEVITYTYIF